MATGIAAIGCRFKKNAEPFIVWMIDRKRLERIPDQAAGAFCAHRDPDLSVVVDVGRHAARESFSRALSCISTSKCV
jgi:hypothetical protein